MAWRRYEDIRLLAAMDERHNTPNGLTMKKLCERAYTVYGQAKYQRPASISVAHLYNLRKATGYSALATPAWSTSRNSPAATA